MKTSEKDPSMNNLVDEIVDEVMDSISKQKNVRNEQVKNLNVKTIGDVDAIAKMKNRLDNLENRVEKYISNYKTSSVEFERDLSERSGNLGKENEKQIMELQGQIEVLRTNMIRLGNELRRVREILMKENLLK